MLPSQYFINSSGIYSLDKSALLIPHALPNYNGADLTAQVLVLVAVSALYLFKLFFFWRRVKELQHD